MNQTATLSNEPGAVHLVYSRGDAGPARSVAVGDLSAVLLDELLDRNLFRIR